MSRWDELRHLARQKHLEALAQSGGDSSSHALLNAAAYLTGVTPRGQRAGHLLLDGGDAVLDPGAGTIWFNRDANPLLIPFYLAHEYGHWWIDRAHATCTASDVDPESTESRIPFGTHRVEGYGPRERRECQANIVGREFLLPAPTLRRWYVDDALNAHDIAARTGLPEGMVLHQLAHALLTPDGEGDPDIEAEQEPAPSEGLDPSQRRAAEIATGPFLLDAGPGTGKTRTLVSRVEHLLGDLGVPPSAILVLTFSNKAAEELRERLARTAPAAAPHIWAGTFHAFGLELLRKYGTRLGLPANPRVLDPADALFLLERAIPDLRLDHYQNLYEPTIVLRDILGAISRAKDELVDPAAYAELAARMQAASTTEKDVERAAKAAEVAHVYARYQSILERDQTLDFGDLIAKSAVLLQAYPDVRDAVRSAYAHILVDEYQDVNRASGVMLKEIAGEGRGLWVVGDVRQSIYRWRGAAPSNLRRFAAEFPGATTDSLSVNYRSQPAIVNTFAALAPRMRATRVAAFQPWTAHRPESGGRVAFEIAADQVAEAEGIARTIKERHAQGVAFRDQAVLCRSHTTLARIGDVLERQGIPILYLGDLFERPEVRDLLALTGLACGGDGRGLVRVARFPEYGIPLADVRVLLRIARESDTPFPKALGLARDCPDISERGKVGLALLDQHIDGLCHGTNAWGLLARYLMVRSSYLRPYLADRSVGGHQRRAALYQFLQFAHQQRDPIPDDDADAKRSFLRLIRRLELFGEEKQLRELPEWASRIDAVRLLTVHGAKGLEFSAVYVPTLGQGHFPARRQGQACPPPDGLLSDPTDADHDEEEECLFFVALSRARDHLGLSRARRYGKPASNPSQILGHIAAHLPRAVNGDVTWPRHGPTPVGSSLDPLAELPIFDVDDLELYLRCPRQYYYERVLGLGGRREDSAYVQFHRCVYTVLRWIDGERAGGKTIDDAGAQERLSEIWLEQGPIDHPYEALYRVNAEEMVSRALRRLPRSLSPADRPTWDVALPHGRVRLQPDQVERLDDGTTRYQRLRTGRISSGEREKDLYALYQVGAASAHSDSGFEIRIVSLSTDTDEPLVGLSGQKLQTRLDRYNDAIIGILTEEYPPNPSDRVCPRCPHYFICPQAEES